MTDRLYYADAYRTRFEARVVDRAEDARRIYLDHSAFYPTSGGQPHDVGSLGGIAVIDVVDEESRVAHVLAAPLPDDMLEGVVEGLVDWPRRRDHMQQHTGQHLLSAIAADRFGWETMSVHFGPESSSLDLGAESISPAAVAEIERLANEAVAENRAVIVGNEDAATAAGLRKPSDRTGMLRIVTVDGMDRSACGGTHVRATGEIGAILLRRSEKVRKTTRLEFRCGQRAIARARADFEILSRIAIGLSCSLDELPALIPAQVEQLRAMENERKRLEEEVSAGRARDRYAALAPDTDGVRRLVERRATGKADDVRVMALALAAQPRMVFASMVSAPPSILLSASADSGIDAGQALKAALMTVGGRGGGGPRLAQGTVPDASALEALLAALGFTPSPKEA